MPCQHIDVQCFCTRATWQAHYCTFAIYGSRKTAHAASPESTTKRDIVWVLRNLDMSLGTAQLLDTRALRKPLKFSGNDEVNQVLTRCSCDAEWKFVSGRAFVILRAIPDQHGTYLEAARGYQGGLRYDSSQSTGKNTNGCRLHWKRKLRSPSVLARCRWASPKLPCEGTPSTAGRTALCRIWRAEHPARGMDDTGWFWSQHGPLDNHPDVEEQRVDQPPAAIR
eukprot:1006610-Amphidinium_carterae.1